MSLYFALLMSSIFFPLLLSFDKKVHFYKHWPAILPAISIVATFYIIMDSIFTAQGIWGFNPVYYSGIRLFHLPLEELLFFIIVPYACLFIHYSLKAYFPKLKLSDKATKAVNSILLLTFFTLGIIYNKQAYTAYICVLMLLSITIGWILDKNQILSEFYLSFLVMLVPFLIINGILTGTGIEHEVVWYNDTQNLGIRFFTIPMEDFFYAFSLIFLNLQLTKLFSKK